MIKKKESSLGDYLDTIFKHRKLILRNVIIIALTAVIISLLLPQKFTSTATMLPPNPEQEAMFGFMPAMLSGNISGMLGGMVPGVSTPSDLYAAIMQSSKIKREIIAKYDLKSVFEAKTMHDAYKILDEITKVDITPEGIVSISITYKDKYLAANIANSYVEELDKFNTETATTVGKRYRIFIEKRLEETEDSLTKAEEMLREFQEKHRTVALDLEIQSAIETFAKLRSEMILLEVKKGAFGSSTGISNPYITNINNQLRELKKQLAKIESGGNEQNINEFGAGFAVPFTELPQVSLEYARLLREVTVQIAIYELLTQQYEQAKIMELKDTPTVQFLDKAGVPERKSYPKRSLIVVFAFFLGIVANIPLVFFLDYLADIDMYPEKHTYAVKFKTNISHDIKELKNFLKKVFTSREP